MSSFLISLIATIAWTALKDGGRCTVELLKKKLRQEKIDYVTEKDCQRIVDEVNQTPDAYTLSEKILEAYLETNEQLLKILSDLAPNNQSTFTQYSFGSGDNVGRDKIVKN